MEMRLILARVFNNYKCSQAAFVDKCGQESKNFTCACTCGGMNQETQGFAGSPATRVSTCSAAVGGTVVYLYLVVPFYLHEILSDVIPIHPANVPMDLFLEIDGHKRSKLSLAVGWIRHFTSISPTKTLISVGRKNTASHMKHVIQPKNECDRSSQLFTTACKPALNSRTSRLCHVRYVHKEADRSRLFGMEITDPETFYQLGLSFAQTLVLP